MELVIHERDDEIMHVALFGRLDATEVQEMEQRLAEAIAARPKPTIVELTGIEFISSLGIGLLIAKTKKVKQAGHTLVLLNPQGMVEEVLKSSRMDKVMPIARDLIQALQLLEVDHDKTGGAGRRPASAPEEVAPRPAQPVSTESAAEENSLKVSIKNEIPELKSLYATVAQFLKRHAIPYKPGYAINLALEELVVNIIRYAHVDDDVHLIDIELSIAGEQIILRIQDDGRPFDPRENPLEARDVENLEPGGLGLVLVLDMVDVLKYARVEDRNRVEVRIHFGAEQGSDDAA